VGTKSSGTLATISVITKLLTVTIAVSGDYNIYADDMVIFAESQEGLQKLLHTLLGYTAKWNLTVNISKPKL
jgi:hypothetical protein